MNAPASIQQALDIQPEMQKVDFSAVAAQPSMTKALILCQNLSGLDDKMFYGAKGVVSSQAQWSRIMGPAGQHNFPQDNLNLFMDIAGNEAPLLWLLHSRGYDLHSLRKRETETERKLRQAEDEIRKLKEEARIKADFVAEFMGRRAA
mgnify:CR=1 FL=1